MGRGNWAVSIDSSPLVGFDTGVLSAGGGIGVEVGAAEAMEIWGMNTGGGIGLVAGEVGMMRVSCRVYAFRGGEGRGEGLRSGTKVGFARIPFGI